MFDLFAKFYDLAESIYNKFYKKFYNILFVLFYTMYLKNNFWQAVISIKMLSFPQIPDQDFSNWNYVLREKHLIIVDVINLFCAVSI